MNRLAAALLALPLLVAAAPQLSQQDRGWLGRLLSWS